VKCSTALTIVNDQAKSFRGSRRSKELIHLVNLLIRDQAKKESVRFCQISLPNSCFACVVVRSNVMQAMVGARSFENGPNPLSVGGSICGEVEYYRCAELQQIDAQRGDDAANSGGGGDVLMQVLDRVCEANHPLVFADQHGWSRPRNLTG